MYHDYIVPLISIQYLSVILDGTYHCIRLINLISMESSWKSTIFLSWKICSKEILCFQDIYNLY